MEYNYIYETVFYVNIRIENGVIRMLVKKIGEIEVYQLDETTKKLEKSEKERIIKESFQNQYQGKILTYKKLDQDMFVRVNARTRDNFNMRKYFERKKAYKARINLGASGDFMDLIQSPEYSRSLQEKKAGQSKRHQQGNLYHYYKKWLIIEDSCYEVTINIRETKKKKCFVHSVSLEEKDLSLLSDISETIYHDKSFYNSIL